MNRTVTAALAALVAVPAAVGLSSTSSASTANDDDFRVHETLTGLKILDFGKKGLGFGDQVAIRSVLKNTGGAKIGIAAGNCTVYSGNTLETIKSHCTSTFKLRGGQIFTGGVFDTASERNYWVIMGGTGEYNGVTGELDTTTKSADTFVDIFRFGD